MIFSTNTTSDISKLLHVIFWRLKFETILKTKWFLEIDLFILLLVLVEETLKEKGREKKQRSPELEEGTHLVTEPICLVTPG